MNQLYSRLICTIQRDYYKKERMMRKIAAMRDSGLKVIVVDCKKIKCSYFGTDSDSIITISE